LNVDAVVGVPLMIPVLESSVRPGGSCVDGSPAVTLQVNGAVPPPGRSVAVYLTPKKPFGNVVVAMVSGFEMIIDTARLAVLGGVPESLA
jgi:hypothetical protein